MVGRRKRGSWGEDVAAEYARRKGARVLARNVRGPRGEVDLVLRDRWTLVFAEVKARRSTEAGLAAVTATKQRRIASTAFHYLSQEGLDPHRTRFRFDVFVVAPGPDVKWFKDAFRLD